MQPECGVVRLTLRYSYKSRSIGHKEDLLCCCMELPPFGAANGFASARVAISGERAF